MSKTVTCDNCDKPLDERECIDVEHDLTCVLWRHSVDKLPMDINSRYAGKSAVLCARCLLAVQAGDASLVWRLTQ